MKIENEKCTKCKIMPIFFNTLFMTKKHTILQVTVPRIEHRELDY